MSVTMIRGLSSDFTVSLSMSFPRPNAFLEDCSTESGLEGNPFSVWVLIWLNFARFGCIRAPFSVSSTSTASVPIRAGLLCPQSAAWCCRFLGVHRGAATDPTRGGTLRQSDRGQAGGGRLPSQPPPPLVFSASPNRSLGCFESRIAWAWPFPRFVTERSQP